MTEREKATAIAKQAITSPRILVVRGVRVLLDADLAALYGIETFNLNKAVARNPERFPPEFSFVLTNQEVARLIFQNGIPKPGRGGRRKPPRVFTEHGVAMLSSVLNSPRAIAVNIEIIRTFIRLRDVVAADNDLRAKLDAMEQDYDEKFAVVFTALRELMDAEAERREVRSPIGFTTP